MTKQYSALASYPRWDATKRGVAGGAGSLAWTEGKTQLRSSGEAMRVRTPATTVSCGTQIS